MSVDSRLNTARHVHATEYYTAMEVNGDLRTHGGNGKHEVTQRLPRGRRATTGAEGQARGYLSGWQRNVTTKRQVWGGF